MSSLRFDHTLFPPELQATAAACQQRILTASQQLVSGECLGAESLGWLNYPQKAALDICQSIYDYKARLLVDYDIIVVIGIGGSYLGTRAVHEALAKRYPNSTQPDQIKPIVYAGHHLCEQELIELLELLSEHRPLINMVSKSGTTTEPAVAFRLIRRFLENKYGHDQAKQRIVVTTDPEQGALRQIVQDVGYQSFAIEPDIGGRYSVLTPVGLLPLGLAGIDIESLVHGARTTTEDFYNYCESPQAQEPPPSLRYAAYRLAAYESDKKIELLAINHPKLQSFVEWWKQLFGESEGKEGKGLFPAGLCYTTDLHSMGQLVQEGERHMFETFLSIDNSQNASHLGIEKSLKIPIYPNNEDQLSYLEGLSIENINDAAIKATKVAHFDGGVPCLEIKASGLNAHTIGSLFSFFMIACATSGIALGINPFDQPGVESYKKNLFGLLGKPGFEDHGAALRKRLAYRG